MLKPREADIPALFLFFIVLPLVTYILLGKWSETAKKKARVSVLAHIAAEEALRAEAMAAATVIPLVSFSNFSKNVVQECARCFAPATTRCSRCKSIKYCSGKCQIVHWRQVHKQECLQSQTISSSSFPNPALIEESLPERLLLNDSRELHFYEYNIKQALLEKALADNIIDPSISTSAYACPATDTSHSQVSPLERRSTDKRLSRKAIKGMLTREDGAKFDSFEEVSRAKGTSSTSSMLSKEVYKKHKLRQNDSVVSEEEISKQQDCSSAVNIIANSSSISTMHENLKMQNQHENICEPRRNPGYSSSLDTEGGTNGHSIGIKFGGGSVSRKGVTLTVGTEELKRCPEMFFVKESKVKGTSYPTGTKFPNSSKSAVKAAEEQSCSEVNTMGQIADESKVATMRDCSAAQGSNGVASRGILEKMGLKKSSNFFGDNASEVRDDRDNKFKMLFPYEEFVKYFQCEVFGISPRGLLNCGNSCYANAVLQCLTCTKPLAIYLLRRSHSRACCVKGWCLMCELEKHIRMLRGTGGPMSPSRILSNMRSINCQIGDGSQEDAHEFLRFLVTSMQSICLKGLDGETVVDPRLQETTFIQHTFGGRLRSKVKCLRCRHVSERYENIMDLTLEILGWVESLEDALTQFTTAEDLDGENMYRCGRCAAYVQAKKQLSIHEAPNILTIVLKRFQEGRYGKINKCITFPDVLDMIPFMSGTDDIPPVYMLYAAVVHLDMLNASFSGHYVSYVKDLQGNWFRVDDTEVQPVLLSQVMSEEAYILFYMRSFPRPPRVLTGKTVRQHAAASSRNCTSKTHKSSRPGQSKQSSHVIGPELSSNFTAEASVAFLNHTNNDSLRSASRDILPTVETYSEPLNMEFSDAKSSDWSLFTSSDEASFTTESTRDSFSTVDYADACNINPFSSIFDTLYAPEHSSRNTASCRAFPNRKLETRFGLEEKGYVSSLSTQPLDRMRVEEDLNQVGDSSIEFPYNTNCDAFVKYRTTEKHSHGRTSSHCKP